ncbi:MAG: ChpI protein [Acidobacteriia bacterium]|nr:ChpI protein [Terriglobia bacterium]
MKTAVSLPDELFELAETAARKLSLSRSKLYAAAIAEYLERRQGDAIRKRLDEVYGRQPAKLDPAFLRAQLKSFDKDSW